MGIWQKIKSKVKEWVSGGGEKKSAPRVQTRSTSSNPRARYQSSSATNYNRRALLDSLREEQREREEKEEKRQENYKATKRGAEDMTASLKRTAGNPDKKADMLKSSQERAKANAQKRKEDLEAYNKATGNKYNVKGAKDAAEKLKARQAQKSQAFDVEASKWETKQHPTITSAARGVTSGASFGASDLLAAKAAKGKAKEAEEFYQKNKNKTAESLGEIGGSLASFGLTAGATEKAAAAVGKKVAPRAVERLAEKEIIKSAAKRSVDKAVKKGLVSEASEELIKQVGKDKAKQIASALGTDVIQNLTTGAMYDINKASAEHDVGSEDWWKELGKSAAFNFGVTGAVAGVSALRGGKGLAKEAAEKLATSKGASVAGNELADEIKTAVKNTPPEVQIKNSIDNTAVKNADEVAEATADNADNVQFNLEDEVKATAEPKAMPKTKEQIKAEKAEDQKVFDSLDGLRKQTKESDAKVREQTGGEFGVRQGERTAAEHSPADEAKRIKKEQDDISKALNDGSIKEMFADDNTPFSVFRTANREERQKVAEAATARINKSSKEVADRLFDKAERLKADLMENSALTSNEHVTLDDVADVIALRNRAAENGIKLPAKYEEAFSHIIEWQRTEAAQMLKATDLFLKENDQQYRKMLLNRDVNNYLRKVLNADNATIADIKRSLDANNGEGYFDNMLEELSKFKGAENEAAFRKAYADFQAEIFMNTKPTVWDTVNLWRHTLMLSSPKTGANNLIGNVLQRTMYNISDALNLAGESAARAINKDVKRTTAVLKSKDQHRLAKMFTSGKLGESNAKNAKYLSGFVDQEFADAINNVANADVGDMMASSKYMGEVVKGMKYKPTTTGGKIQKGINNLGGAISNKYVSTMLNEPDSWFVERNYRSALLKYLEANGVNSAETLKGNEQVLKDARAFAKDVALENTYKKANNVVSFLEGIRKKGHTKGSNLGYKTGALVLDAELPYLKVPANLVVNNFKYSPLGAFKSGVDAAIAIRKGDAAALNKATRELSKGLTGTGMMILGAMMFCDDQADDDSTGFIANAKDELKEYGVRDNSFKIGNKNFSIANMGIGSVQFLMGAALAEDMAENGQTPTYQMLIDSISKNVDTIADMSLMENAVALLDAFGNGGDYNATVSDRLGNAAAEVAGDYAAQFIPNPLRGIAKGITDADLDTGIKKGSDRTKVQKIMERNKNNFVQGLPVINEAVLPHRVDTHGNLIGERNTPEDKAKAVANNLFNPLSPKTVNIPEADKEELKVLKDDGTPYKPKGFDQNREYKAKVGVGKGRAEIKLTGKEREQVARAAKNAGYDGTMSLVKKGMFGDRLGDRAQEILQNVPDDEEKAREYIFSTPEWKNASNAQKEKWLNAWYGEGQGNTSKGVSRTRNAEAFIGIAGNSEGDFRWQNDISSSYQKKYNDAELAEAGIDKGTWVDILEACQDSNHKWNEETLKNQDTINSAKKTKLGILSVEGLTPEQRIAAYDVIRGKRTGFGWNDWDGASAGGGYYRRGRGYSGYHGYGGGSRKAKVPALKQSDYKATTRTYKNTAAALKTSSSRSKGLSTASNVKVKPPKVKFKKYEI